MKITGLSQVHLESHPPDVRKWFRAWVAEVKRASWLKAADVVGQFPKAVQLSANHFCFQTPDTTVEVAVVVAFQQGVVLIMRDTTAGGSNGA